MELSQQKSAILAQAPGVALEIEEAPISHQQLIESVNIMFNESINFVEGRSY